MYQSNYFQKAAIALISLMVLTIPNLHVYSAIGRYQAYSQTISANADYSNTIERQGLNDLCCLNNTTSNCLYESQATMLKATYESIQDYLNHYVNSTSKVHPLSFKTKNYAKYDFSGFDN